MPLYEYQCTACEHKLEALQKMTDDPLVYCPICNEPSLKKMISAAGFRLKGTGWYETDFKNSGKKSTTEDKKSTSTDDAGSSKPESAGKSEKSDGDSSKSEKKSDKSSSSGSNQSAAA